MRPLHLLALLPLAGCTPPTAPGGDVGLVTSFRVDPAFNNFREPCAVAYTLAAPAVVSLRVTTVEDGERRLVATLAEDQAEPKGGRSAAWRGTGPTGGFVPQGAYAVELTARRASGHSEPVSWTLPTYLYRD